MPISKRGKSWVVRMQINGKQIRRSAGVGSTFQQALALERSILDEELPNRRKRTPKPGWVPPQKTTKIQHLYRHFDDAGRLLYVGVSLSALFRLLQHHSTAHWGEEIVTVTIERFATRAEVLRAEREAIENESPLYNVAKLKSPNGRYLGGRTCDTAPNLSTPVTPL